MLLEAIRRLEAGAAPHGPALVHCDLRLIDAAGRQVSGSFWKYQRLEPSNSTRLAPLLVQNVVTGCASLFNRALAERASPIPEGVVMHDWWLALCCAAFGRTGWTREPLVDYRQHGRNQVGAERYGAGPALRAIARRVAGDRLAGDARAAEQRRAAAGASHLSQAAAFLARYGEDLPGTSREMLRDFLCLPRVGLGRRVALSVRHGFWRTGWLRNVLPIVSTGTE